MENYLFVGLDWILAHINLTIQVADHALCRRISRSGVAYLSEEGDSVWLIFRKQNGSHVEKVLVGLLVNPG